MKTKYVLSFMVCLSLVRQMAGAPDAAPVKTQKATYRVIGHVKKAGSYPWAEGTSVQTALATADVQRAFIGKTVYIFRKDAATETRETIELNLAKLTDRKAMPVFLQAGDILYVPGKHDRFWPLQRNWDNPRDWEAGSSQPMAPDARPGQARFTVMGNVKKPGTYELRPHSTVLGALGMSQGWAKTVIVYRKSNSITKRDKIEIVLGKPKPGQTGTLELQSDDIVYVPGVSYVQVWPEKPFPGMAGPHWGL